MVVWENVFFHGGGKLLLVIIVCFWVMGAIRYRFMTIQLRCDILGINWWLFQI